MRLKIIFLIIYMIAISYSSQSQNNKPDFLASKLDTTVNPADDFFQYANGGWIKNNPIPNDESEWGITKLVKEENLKKLKEVNEKAATSKNQPESVEQKIGDFWKAAMDSTTIEKQGLKPLKPYLNQINAIKNKHSLLLTIAALHKIGIQTIIGMAVEEDDKNSSIAILKFYQSGLYLPEREYYLQIDSTSNKIRNGYWQLIINFLKMNGISQDIATQGANSILSLETEMAKSYLKREDLRNPYLNYNKMGLDDFDKLIPSLQLKKYLKILNVPQIDSIIVKQPEYYKVLNYLFDKVDISTWKMMLTFRLLEKFAEALPSKYEIEKFKFTALINGIKKQKPRWKRVLIAEENTMGELLGQLFVKKLFSEKTKKRYENLVEAIKEAYKHRIEHVKWMSDSTKCRALYKLATMKKKIGYPGMWKDFSTLHIKRDNYLSNLIRINKFQIKTNLEQLHKPINKELWEMTPQTFSAYYQPLNNEIVIPAARFIVPGYADEELDDAFVYGYVGATPIGHEITHGFDDKNNKYDENGNLNNWWTDEDKKQFDKRAKSMMNYFNQYIVIDTFRINGKATVGENIADLGGLVIAWDAFVKTQQYKENKSIAGLTPAKRFFLGYATRWLNKETKESLYNQILTDTHSPAKYRVNGSFSNVDAFYNTFNVKPRDKMYIPDSLRVRIW